MPRSLSYVTALLATTALTVTACSSDDSDEAQEVVTVTATAEVESAVQDDGPNPTGAGSVPAVDPEGAAPDHQSEPDPAIADGQIALTGNVVEMTAGELMDGQRTPNGEPTSERHIILQLNSPQLVEAQKSGAPGTMEKTISQISLATPVGSLSSINWDSFVGKEVTVLTTADGLWFPSDTGLPLGMVRLSEGTVR